MHASPQLPCFRPCQASCVKSNVCQPQSYPSQEVEARSFTVSPSSANNNYGMGLKIAGSSPVNSFEVDQKVREENVAAHPFPFSLPMAQLPSSLPSPNYYYYPYPVVRAAYYPAYMVNPGSVMSPTARASSRARPYACLNTHNVNCGASEAAMSEKCVLSSLDILVALSKRELEMINNKNHMGVTLCSEKEMQSSLDDNL